MLWSESESDHPRGNPSEEWKPCQQTDWEWRRKLVPIGQCPSDDSILNRELPPDAIDEAFRKLLRADAPSLIERNRLVHRMLVDGVPVEYHRKDGSIAGAQAHWLAKTLKARAEHPNAIVVNHVPAYPSYRKMGKEGTGEGNRKHWVPLFERYRVPVVLEHHDHTFKRTKPLLEGASHANGVLYLGDGSWGRLRTPEEPERLPYLAVTSREYHLSLHRLQGEERFHLALDERGRVMDICRSGQRLNGVVRASG